MHFLLEYIHKKNQGEGYKMKEHLTVDAAGTSSGEHTNAEDKCANDRSVEVIGQMFIDDSNWVADTIEGMTRIAQSCEDFVTFHAL